jgi:hypothetical protein
MASGSSGFPPEIPALFALGLLGLVSLDAYETRRDNLKLFQQEQKPLKKREAAFCRSHAALVSVWERTRP